MYYVQFRDQGGDNTSVLRTDQTSKSAASAWATEYLKQGYFPTKRGFTCDSFGGPHGTETEEALPVSRGVAVAIDHSEVLRKAVPATAPTHPV